MDLDFTCILFICYMLCLEIISVLCLYAILMCVLLLLVERKKQERETGRVDVWAIQCTSFLPVQKCSLICICKWTVNGTGHWLWCYSHECCSCTWWFRTSTGHCTVTACWRFSNETMLGVFHGSWYWSCSFIFSCQEGKELSTNCSKFVENVLDTKSATILCSFVLLTDLFRFLGSSWRRCTTSFYKKKIKRYFKIIP